MKKIKLFLFSVFYLLGFTIAVGQVLNVTATKRDACAGSVNGSITLAVDNTTTTLPPYSYTVIDLTTSAVLAGVLTKGVPLTLPNLADHNHFVLVGDNSPLVPNFSAFLLILDITPGISFSSAPIQIDNSSCATPNGSISIFPTGGAGPPYLYSWTGSNGFTSNSQNISNLAGGTYNVVVSEASSNCTVTSGAITITDPSPAVFNLSTSTPTICNGQSGTIDLNGSDLFPPSVGAVLPGATYQLYLGAYPDFSNPVGAPLNGTGGAISFSVPNSVLTAAGSYSFFVLASNGLCSSVLMTGTPTIIVNPLPVPTISGPIIVCANSTGNIYTTEAGNAAYVWNIVGGTITSGLGTNSVTVTWTTSGSQSISVNYADANGCSAALPTSKTITVIAAPTPTITGASSVCVGTTASVYTTEAAQFSYNWTIVGGTITAGAGTNSVTVDWPTAGPQSISVTYSDLNGCSPATPTSKSVTVNLLPIPTITGSSTGCISSTGNVYSTESGNSAYVWTVSGGTITSGASTASITVTWTSTGPQIISVTYLDVNGCSPITPTSSNVTINPLPTVSAPSATLCAGATMTLSPASGGTWVSSNNAVAIVTNAGLVTGVSAGVVTFTFTDATTSCSNTTTSVTIQQPTVSTPSPTLCIGATITLSPSTGGTWVSSDNTLATVTNAGVVTGVSTGTVTFTFTETATGCSNTTSSVTVNGPPIITIPSSLCVGATANLLPNTSGTWISTNPAVATVTNAGLATGISAGSAIFTFTDATTGCSSSSVPVLIQQPTVSAPLVSLCIGATMNLSPSTGGTWLSSNNAIATVTNVGLVTGVTAGSVTFTFTETLTGCSNTTSSLTINALPIVSAPSATLCVAATLNLSPSTGGTWISSDNTVATVTNAGVVTGVSAGTATFIFTDGTTGCSNTTASVTIQQPTVSAPSTTLCVGATMNLTPSTGGTWVSSDNTVATVTNAGLVTGVLAGTVTFTFTETATGCSNTTASVTIQQPTVSVPSATLCLGATMTLSPTSGGTWISSNNAVATVTNAGLVTSVSTGSVTFTYTDGATGCSNTTSSVTINPLPIVSTPSATLCVGATLNLSPSTGGTWVSSDNTVATVTNAGVATGILAGTVTFTFTDGTTGCSNTTSSINIAAPPTVSSPPASLCIGATIILSPSLGGTWVSSDNTIATVTNAGLVTGVAVGTATFTFTDSGTGCSNTTSFITIGSTPVTSSITGNATVCANTIGVVYSVTNTAGSSYTWTIGGGAQASGGNSNSITVNWGAGGSGSVQVIETNASGCVGTLVNQSVLIDVAPSAPTFNPVTTTTYCVSQTITPPSIASPVLGSTYRWYNNPSLTPASFLVAGTNPTVAGLQVPLLTIAPPPYTVYVTETNSAGCTGPATSFTITIVAAPALPVVSFTPDTYCIGATINPPVVTSPVSGSTYSWYSDPSLTLASLLPTVNGITPTNGELGFSSASANTTIVYVAETNGTCQSSGTAVILTVNGIATSLGPGVNTWVADVFDDAGNSSVPYENGVLNNANYRGYLVESEIGAFGTSSYNSITDEFDMNLSNNIPLIGTNVCGSYLNNYSIRFQMKKTFAIGGLYTFSLSGDDGVQFYIGGILQTLSPAGSFTDHAFTTYTTDPICITAGNDYDLVIEYYENGGFSRVAFGYSVITAFTPTITAGQPNTCVGTPSSYSTEAGFSFYNWSVTGGTITAGVGTNAITVSWPAAGPGVVSVSYTDAAGCIAPTPTISNITINDIPDATITPAGPFCLNDLATNLTAATLGGLWSGTGITNAALGTFDPAVAGTGTFTITYSVTVAGCSGSKTIDITVNPPPSITLGASPIVCFGTTSANLPYASTTNSPNEFSIDYNAAAEAEGFVDVAFAALPVGQVGILVPATATAATYNAFITVRNTATGCVSNNTAFTVQIDALPTISNAGPDQLTACGTVTLAGNVPAVGTGNWTFAPGGNPDGIGAILTSASNASGFNGTPGITYILRWTISNGVCASSSDNVTITFSTPGVTPASAGIDQSNCNSSNFTMAANLPAVTETGTWSIVLGSATITNPSLNTTTVTGISVGTSAILRWSIFDGVSCTSFDDVTLSNNGASITALAGADQAVCGVSATLAGNAPAPGTGTWTIFSGAGGSIASVNNPTSSFTGVAGTTYMLRWTITNGGCPSSSDDVTIQLDQAPTTAAAGPDQSNVCGTISLNANTSIIGIGAWSIVSGAGGAFGDTTDPQSDFNGAAGATYTLRWTITNGTCLSTDDVIINYDPVGPTPAKAGVDQAICGLTSTTLAANNPTTGIGKWSFAVGGNPDGLGVFTDVNNQVSGFSGTIGQTYLLNWTVTFATCVSVDQVSIRFNNPPSLANAGSDQSICAVTSATLNATAPVVGIGAWSIVSGIGGSITTPSSPTSTFTGVVGSVYFLRWTITNGGCVATDDVRIAFLAPADPLCGGGGGVNCGAFVITPIFSGGPDVITRPSCASQDDGKLVFSVSLFPSGSSNFRFTLSKLNDPLFVGQVGLGVGPFIFDDLSPGDYQYKVEDLISGNSCGPTGNDFSLKLQTTVSAVADPLSFVDATCFGKPNGQAKLTITGGNSPYEYSVDGGANYFQNLVSGNTISNLPPKADFNGNAIPYNILVRDDTSDTCPATVSVTINNANHAITATAPTITDATCANNDGSITIGTIAGGAGGPYTFRFDSVAHNTIAQVNAAATKLSGGVHKFTVIDKIGCEKYFKYVVNFPGLVLYTTSLISNPSCSGSGNDGAFNVTITQSGSFQAGITTDPINLPTQFTPPAASTSTNPLTIPFTNLSKNTYYVYVQAVGSLCPTRSTFSINVGVDKIDFIAKGTDFICFNSNKLDGKVTLSSIKGQANTAFDYQIFGKPRSVGDLPVLQGVITAQEALTDVALPGLNISGLKKGDYEILLKQNQTSCLVQSVFTSFSVNGPVTALDTLYVRARGETPEERKKSNIVSLPDIATGFVNIGIKQSGTEPYESKLELVVPNPDPAFPPLGFDSGWKEVPLVKVDNVDTYQLSVSNLYAGVYRLSIRDALGCERTYYNNNENDFNDPRNFLKVNVDTKIEIPNVFTPNNDGANDEFYIRNLPENSTVSVASRWGAEVYASSNYKNDWNGGSTPDGIYYYRISAGGSVFTGWVEIIRGK